MTDTKKGGLGKGVGKGVLAAAVLAAAGYYFYASKNAKKNRHIAAQWAEDLKKDVIKRAKALKRVDRAAFAAIVEQSTRAYKGIRELDRGEVERAAKELKSNWEKIVRELKKDGTSAVKAAKSAVKKAKKGVRKISS